MKNSTNRVICPGCGKVNDLALDDGAVDGPREYHAECWMIADIAVTENQLQDMITVIHTTQGATDFIVGSEKIEDVAQSWINNEFNADDVSDWWDAGCWDADRTSSLRGAGLEPSNVSGECPQLDGYSWGYAHSNGDVTTEEVVEACK